MKNDWILDVLADLRNFAHANGLDALAAQLEDTKLVATAEITSIAERSGTAPYADETKTGSYSGGARTSARA
ncbi:hypothetical protein FAP39_00845 [Shimia litoralis]|uniref:Uncharacterized protein n=1 Tax=Shimia litoralis TaxID=420403 RepID=A0A4U7N8Z7_9RHOB|nr:hypothetical protein FAP39_00845 [Shimia litoralis]